METANTLKKKKGEQMGEKQQERGGAGKEDWGDAKVGRV